MRIKHSLSKPQRDMTTMNRRNFLKMLGLVTLSPLVHASAEMRAQTRKVYLQTVYIAGLYYYDGMDMKVFSRLSVGDELELRREAHNPHDENAIEVYTQDGHKLGYVPQIENPIPAAIADQNVAIGAEISGLEPTPDYFPAVFMRLYMVIVEPPNQAVEIANPR